MKDALTTSDRFYQALLRRYPPDFRRRFTAEMAQVFRLACRDAQISHGRRGLLKLWLLAGWDWCRSVVVEWWDALTKRRIAMDTSALDRQLGDMIWTIQAALFAGYSFKQNLEALAQIAPEPAAGACRRLLEELNAGHSFEQAVERWKQAFPSPYLERLVSVLLDQQKTGGHLAYMLEPLRDEIRLQVGSDGAFDPMLREQAIQLGAPPPDPTRFQSHFPPEGGRTSPRAASR
jgi:hypothetical protein